MEIPLNLTRVHDWLATDISGVYVNGVLSAYQTGGEGFKSDSQYGPSDPEYAALITGIDNDYVVLPGSLPV